MASEGIGLYIHVPFCRRKCPYCDFFSLPDQPELHSPLISALCQELESHGSALATRTIYLGGGTPNTLSGDELAKFFTRLLRRVDLSPLLEFTAELNPLPISEEIFTVLSGVGVSRIGRRVGSNSFPRRTSPRAPLLAFPGNSI